MAAYADTEDYEQRCPSVASESAAHRSLFREKIGDIVTQLRELRSSERAAALSEVEAGELDPQRVAATAMQLARELDEAAERNTLKEDLLADAFGVAAWSIGVRPGEEPHVQQLAHLSDPRLRLVIARFQPLYA